LIDVSTFKSSVSQILTSVCRLETDGAINNHC
jgi:hypothetical protein